MLKRGQITISLIVGMVIVMLIGFYIYISNFSAKMKSIAAAKIEASTDIVKVYAESCIKMVSEDALFNRIGLQGGYINPDGDSTYQENGVPNPPPASYLGKKVPIYVKGISGTSTTSAFIPDLGATSRKLAKYIEVEFEKCFRANVFADIGIDVLKTGNINAEVGLNEEDVIIELKYPLSVKIANTETKFESFRVNLPIRLKALYDGSVILVENIMNAQPNEYDIASDCNTYDKNGLTNIYLKNSNDTASKIIQVVDFSTYQKNYLKSYIFQFAVKNVNVNGNCVG
jgi:hypothetical protein